MFLVVSETATHASRLQSTVQIALRGDSGYISGHLDVGRAATVAQTVDSQSTVCAERTRCLTRARATHRLIALGSGH